MTSQNGTEATTDRAAISAASHSPTDRPPVETVELANRVVLRVRPVASFLLREAARAIPEPQPPKVWIESRGKDRNDPQDPGWEANPDSPSYKRALVEWNMQCDLASLKVALILGTTIESLPEGVHPVESDVWIDDIIAAAVAAEIAPPPVRREPAPARYLDWLRLYAVPSEDDIFRLSRLCLSGTLVTEEELADSLSTFRSGKAWAANLAAALVSGDQDGNRLQANVSGDGS